MSKISYNIGNASSSAGMENIRVAYTFLCQSYLEILVNGYSNICLKFDYTDL